MKKLKILSLVLVLCVGMSLFVACSSYNGTYYWNYLGTEMTTFYIEISGSSAIMDFGMEVELDVEISGDTIELKTEGIVVYSGTIDGNTIVLDIDGISYTFIKN